MNRFINGRAIASTPLFIALLFMCLFFAAPAFAQESGTAAPTEAEQQGTGNQGGELLRVLQLTPEQIARIRMIREQNKEERRLATERLRSAQRALDEAIYTDNASEAVIEERSRELAQAQAASARLRALTELSIRRVLTPEQIGKLRQMRQRQAQRRLERELGMPRRLRDRQPLAPRERFRLRANELDQQTDDSRNGTRAGERRREALRKQRP